jgi:AcrR family transcriptional regulator
MAQRPQYTIGEVVERTGVPATTIHHYRNLGLLPPPEKAGANRFAYDERHVQAVRLVRLLRDRRNLSLETIRDVLPELLAVDEEAFRPDMWDQVVASHRSAYGLSDREGSTRRAIVAAARRAFASRGYADVNMADVAEDVGVGKGTVYRQFASKEELFTAAAAAAVASVGEGFAARVGQRGASVDDVTAACLLAAALEPELPLLLDFVNRALRHQPHADQARTLFGDLAAQVRDTLGPGPPPGPGTGVDAGPGSGGDRGEQVLERALAEALRSTIGRV